MLLEMEMLLLQIPLIEKGFCLHSPETAKKQNFLRVGKGDDAAPLIYSSLQLIHS